MTFDELGQNWPHLSFMRSDGKIRAHFTDGTLSALSPEEMHAALSEMQEVLIQGPPSTELTRIHVNKNRIASNRKHGTRDPVVTAKTYSSSSVKSHRENRYGHEAAIKVGNVEVARVVYRPDDPLSCGARLWIETDYPVDVISTYEDE